LTPTVQRFEANRPLLFGIAYRMLGSIAEAEDVVQDAFLRYQAVPPDTVEQPRAFLCTIVTRLALDQLKSARARREAYVGSWLPEPLLTQDSDDRLDPDAHVGTSESISLAFLVLLESLTPVERAVFLLREVFDFSYPEIANIIGKNEAACRQTFHRARQSIADRRPRFPDSPEVQRRLTDSFVQACTTGNLDNLLSLLTQDITLWADGGGKVHAAVHPIQGRDHVARFLFGILRKAPRDMVFEETEVNGAPGIVGRVDGTVSSVLVLEIGGGLITGIRIVANPDKLAHLNQR
jgi:RNA polymerase sigma-70 factor (ECF subfamily)